MASAQVVIETIMMIRANMFLMKTQVIIRIMMIIFSSSISTTLLNEDGQKKEKKNAHMESSAKNQLRIPAARLHRHRLWPEQHGHQVDTETVLIMLDTDGADDANAKENYYIGRTMMNTE